MLEKIVENTAVNLLKLSTTQLPSDVKEAIMVARRKETNSVAQGQLDAILTNIDIAERSGTPMCQDTGIIVFYLNAGEGFPILSRIPIILKRATKRATALIPLRPNAVDPFTEKNSGDNTGKHLPDINWEIVEGDSLQITAFPKGGGSENVCTVGMLSPGLGLRGVKKFIIDAVISAGAKPCLPIILGIGIGGGSDIALKLAKKALLRPLSQHSENVEVAEMEKGLLELINETGLGPMGLGGDTTAIGVNVEYAHRHPASMPVGVAFQCWAARKASAKIWADGRVEYLTHEVKP